LQNIGLYSVIGLGLAFKQVYFALRTPGRAQTQSAPVPRASFMQLFWAAKWN